MSSYSFMRAEIKNRTSQSLMIGLGMHALFLSLTLSLPEKEKKIEEEPKQIAISLVAPKHTIPTMKQVVQKTVSEETRSPIQEQEQIKKPLPQKIEAGTEKVVKDSKHLGNPNATERKVVQKGDPMSTKRTKYDPSTELRKLDRANIGTGMGKVASAKTMNPGGGVKTAKTDVYKGFNFQSSVDGTLAKGGSIGNISAKNIGSGSGMGEGAGSFGSGGFTGTTQGTLNKSKIATNMGSLTGADVGEIGVSKGAEGLSHRGTVLVAGIPSETVVLGSIDPDSIRRVLLAHLAQFRYCYQSELDQGDGNKNFAGLVKLDFTISERGSVTQAQVKSDRGLTSGVTGCVKNVLLGLEFPAPKGGGFVQVNQPMNFYPKGV